MPRCKFGFKLNVASPAELTADPETPRLGGRPARRCDFSHRCRKRAAEGADCVVSDTWVSMGDDNATKRHNLLQALSGQCAS